jgi:hypothetical protein
MSLPYFTGDGTQVVPVRNVCCHGCERLNEATGEIRWHYERGAEFIATFPGISHFELSRYFKRLDAGDDRSVPEWTAETLEGCPVSIYAINSLPISTNQTALGREPRDDSRVEVEAMYACVDLTKKSPLALWHSTDPTTRMMCLGFNCNAWLVSGEVTYEDADGAVHTKGRGSTELCPSPRIQLVSEAHFKWPTDIRACWLVADQTSVGLTYPHRNERGFISFISGKRTRFFWHDTFLGEETLRRTYYGWERVPRHELEMQYAQPLPLYGTVDAINHASEVAPKLPGLYREFLKQVNDLRVTWILNPIWAGATEILDDQFTFACVSLERLAQAWKEKCDREQRPRLFSRTQAAQVETAIRKRMQALARVMQLNPAQADLLDKRVNDICRAPNADLLAKVFTDLEIELTSDDRSMLNDRNKALHGRATLTPLYDPDTTSMEHLRCLRLQTLISKAILRILKYEGPYINFATQGASQVEYL